MTLLSHQTHPQTTPSPTSSTCSKIFPTNLILSLPSPLTLPLLSLTPPPTPVWMMRTPIKSPLTYYFSPENCKGADPATVPAPGMTQNRRTKPAEYQAWTLVSRADTRARRGNCLPLPLTSNKIYDFQHWTIHS